MSMTKTSMTLMLMLLMVTMMMSYKNNKMKMKMNSPFECGFNNMMNMKNFMSINFLSFLFSFLILEMEIILMIPIIKQKKMMTNQVFFWTAMIMLTSMMMTEWKNNNLKWN